MRPRSPGESVAAVLAGAWRPGAPAPEVSPDELAAVAPLLHRTGAAALAWWRLQPTALAETPDGEGFHQAYRLHALEAEVHALRASEVLARLAEARIESILVKGWAIARQYPEPGLRPYTDLDLMVPPGRAAAARAALARSPAIPCLVDLHEGSGRLDALDFATLRKRSEIASLGGCRVRVLGPEDHLRVLALHALRHGVFRPLWLVDLAVAVERRPATFDWARCLGPTPRHAGWVATALGLAARLLGARVEEPPAASRGALPGWLVRAVLRNWERGEGTSHLEPVFPALVARLGDPGRLWAEARRRWDRPIEATLEMGCAFSRFPPWPIQVAAVVRRAPELVRAVRAAAGARRRGR